jgi:hypothetical protein
LAPDLVMDAVKKGALLLLLGFEIHATGCVPYGSQQELSYRSDYIYLWSKGTVFWDAFKAVSIIDVFWDFVAWSARRIPYGR